MKELSDADKIRTRLLDCELSILFYLIRAKTPGVETAAFKDQPEEEIDRLMHMIVVGGGPTGVEYAGELHDFLIVGRSCLRH